MAMPKTKLIAASALISGFAAAPVMAQSDGAEPNWDLNDDGVVTQEEYMQGRDEGGSFDRADKDGDGILNRDEYNVSSFDHYDADKSGDLDEDEMEQVYAAHSEGPFSSKQIKP